MIIMVVLLFLVMYRGCQAYFWLIILCMVLVQMLITVLSITVITISEHVIVANFLRACLLLLLFQRHGN